LSTAAPSDREAPAAAPAADSTRSNPADLFAALLATYLSPDQGFRAAMRFRPWAPLVLLLAVQTGYMGVWLQKVDKAQFVRQQWEEYGVWDRIPEERRGLALERAERGFARNYWLGVWVGVPVLLIVLGGLFLLVYRFFYGSDVTYKQTIMVVAWSFASVSLVVAPMSLGIMALKDDFNLNPEEALQANPTLLFDLQALPRPLYSALASLDLVSFWRMFLLATGFGAAANKSWKWAAPGILAPWVLFVLGKTAAVAMLAAL
jgi:hypothetical protein